VTDKILAPRNNPICPPTFAEKCYNNNGDTLWYQTLQMVGVFFVFPSIFVIILGFPLFDVEQQ
jgi:hypothetical protein